MKQWWFKLWLILGLIAAGPVHALCVFMQDFDPATPEFANYVKKDFYYPALTKVVSVGEYENLPVPTKVQLAGENCYIFKSYAQLKKYIQQGPPTTEYQHPNFAEKITLPVVLPGEPLLIHQISHGGRCGEVEAGDILMFARVMGIMHPIALTNNACFSSDLLAKMLLDQQQDPTAPYISNFCLMTVSPFSHVQMELDHDDFDQSTAAFIAGMNESTLGLSFADYYRQHNFYQDLQGQKRPLGIISAANWDELGLTAYLQAGEEIFNFTGMKFPFTKAEEIMRKGLPTLAEAFFPERRASKKFGPQRVQAAANLINHVNELLNASFAQTALDPAVDEKLWANRQYLYLAANHICKNLDEIRDAQRCLPMYHLSHQSFLNGAAAENRARANWREYCQEDEALKTILYAMKAAPEGTIKERFLDGMISYAAKLQIKCNKVACQDIGDNGHDDFIIFAAENAATPEEFWQRKDELLSILKEKEQAYLFPEMLSKLLKEHAQVEVPPGELTRRFNEYYLANDIDPQKGELDCHTPYETYFAECDYRAGKEALIDQCASFYQSLRQKKPRDWPKLPTNYVAGDVYPDYLAQILLGALDINTQNGCGLNGICASNGDYLLGKSMEMDDYYAPSRELLFRWHDIMEQAMARPPQDEFPLDVKRRMACENFKLGGVAENAPFTY